MNQSRTLSKPNLIVLSVIIFLAVASTLSSSLISHLGIKLDQLNKKTQEIAQENEKLSQQILSLSSLHYLKEYAKEKDFISNKNLLVLSPEKPLAQKKVDGL